jgi:hypothetical protein
MVIITNITYPPESAQDMANRFLEAPQLPDFMTRKGPYISSNLSAGVLTTSLYELDNSRLAEGMEFLGNYLTAFFGISGYKYEIKTFFAIEEALKMIGIG